MAIGCNFICDNENCEHHGKMIVLTGAWPMASIEQMIAAADEDKDDLEALRDHERLYACLTLPRKHEIKTEAYRIQKWCSKCNLISVFETQPEDLEEVSDRTDICMSCEKENLMSFATAIEKGVKCPFCKTAMRQERWYVNEQ